MANYVKGEGNLQSKIWLIGEAPGENEDKTGRPFCGGAGYVLDGLLQEVGIRRSECYVDNVIQYRPPSNNFGVYYEDAKRDRPTGELQAAHERIKALVAQYKPNVVVALGGEALYALCGKKHITKWRGSILPCGTTSIKVIPTYHPAMLMRQFDWRPASLFDFTKVKEQSLKPEFPIIPKDNYKIKPDYAEAMCILDYLAHVHEGLLAFDIETSMDLNQITSIAFAWNSEQAACIPIFYGETSYWTPVEETAIIQKIKQVLEKPKKRLIAHNASFDLTYLKYRWGIDCVDNLYMDTMIAHHCVYPELQKSLAFVVSIYTNHPYHKDMIHGTKDEFYTYNCMDAARTFECAVEIEKEAKEFGTWDFYRQYPHSLIKPLLDMQLLGCRINVQLRSEIDKNLESDLTTMQARLDFAVGRALNVGSPKQMCEFLYTELGLPAQYTNRKDAKTGEKKKTMSADDDALELLIERYGKIAPVLKLIQDIREVRKLLSTYIRADIDADERIRCNYAITGTVTGRLSSREGVLGTGTNLQNIPRGPMVRSLFVPDPGFIFVNADLSQAEARVVAYLAEEERLQIIFEQGGDVHKRNASIIFQKNSESVTEEERELGKRLVHAANYGIGARKFAKTIGKSEDKARELLNTYFAIYPRIKRWHTTVQEEIRKTRILTTPLGRKRIFFGRWSDDLLREAIAYVPQSTVGDILNLGLSNAFDNMPDQWRFILQNHDAVLFQVPKATPHMLIYKFVQHFFNIPIEINRKTLRIPVDIKVGLDWGHLKKLEV